MAVTMRDVAAHAGVSQRTVSNVVTGAVPVRPETRARVEASIAALGYRTFGPARQLRQGRTSTVTLALPGLTEPYFAELAQCVVDRAREHGLRVVVVTTRGDRAEELAILRGDQVFADGVIMSAVGLAPEDETLPHPSLPTVLIGDRGAGADVAHVTPDNRAACRDAVRHLVALGRRRVALVGAGTGPPLTCQERTAGYRDALAEAGLPLDPALLVPCAWNFDAGRQAVAEALERVPDVDAVFAMNDSSALGALQALVRAGRRVPDDVAVAGFDNMREGAHATPGLTSVGPLPDEVAAAALGELRRQLAGEPPRRHQLPHRLVERGSTSGVG
ncbi:MAG TPA: LacI family DNA-binding transcriptional regulator [Actinotalea caeni]|uniref:LacI family DNA-binding transcriptional regulator n=1 Tax=Actinotalea caeni TaxID=1348467 RepID=UPI002B4AC31A|nr:LacI family DNA-binding transcriptional regulator [Actinotalea caeni]HLV54962.1 LacI family DNA-binding transcriptional regulator [Actinotalea caeni]